jgi:hypothetical protein
LLFWHAARWHDVEQNLLLSLRLLGMTTIGHLGVPLLRLLSMPGLLYFDFYFVRNAYVEWQAERQIGIAASDAVLATGLLVTRQWGADALFITLFFTSRKLQAEAEARLSHEWPVAPDGPTAPGERYAFAGYGR